MKEFDFFLLLFMLSLFYEMYAFIFIYFFKDPLAVSLIELIILWDGNLTHEFTSIHT